MEKMTMQSASAAAAASPTDSQTRTVSPASMASATVTVTDTVTDTGTAAAAATAHTESVATPSGGFKMPMFGSRLGIQKTTGLAFQAFGDDDSPLLGTDEGSGQKKPSETKEAPPESKSVVATNRSEDEKDGQSSQKVVPSKLSPAEILQQSQVPVSYKEPSWGGMSDLKYSFEVVKNGMVIDIVELDTKSFYIFGRLPSCDVTLEHPSLSRYHAVVQYCNVVSDRHDLGWYLYDLDSTHGTWMNKIKVKARVYHKLRVGYVTKFGGSTRLFILQGPADDQDEESELSVTEIKEQREKQKIEAELLKRADLVDAQERQLRAEQAEADQGCSWGIDDEEEDELDANPFALGETQNEELYIDDPKKALRGYFEREGYDLPEYEVEEVGQGKYKCMVEIPLDTGETICAEVSVSGKKREAVAECALEGCRILDRQGLLRKSTHESRARKKKDWEENDFYDSDEDVFLDRTGDIEKKRKMRMQKQGKEKKKTETYQSLTKKHDEIGKEIQTITDELEKAKAQKAALEDEGLDAMDAFMESLKAGALDTKARMKLKRQLFELKQEQQKLQRLINIAKPALPAIHMPVSGKTSVAPLVGKMKGTSKHSRPLPHRIAPLSEKPVSHGDAEVEEEEEEEDEDDATNLESGNSMEVSPAQDVGSSPSKKVSVVVPRTLGAGDAKPVHSSPGIQGGGSSRLSGPARPDAGQEGGGVFDDRMSAESSANVQDAQHRLQEDGASLNDGQDKTGKDDRSAPQGSAPFSTEFKSKKRKTLHQIEGLKGDKGRTDLSDPNSDLADDPKYAAWLPPEGQTGDGKTHLNAKFGY